MLYQYTFLSYVVLRQLFSKVYLDILGKGDCGVISCQDESWLKKIWSYLYGLALLVVENEIEAKASVLTSEFYQSSLTYTLTIHTVQPDETTASESIISGVSFSGTQEELLEDVEAKIQAWIDAHLTYYGGSAVVESGVNIFLPGDFVGDGYKKYLRVTVSGQNYDYEFSRGYPEGSIVAPCTDENLLKDIQGNVNWLAESLYSSCSGKEVTLGVAGVPCSSEICWDQPTALLDIRALNDDFEVDARSSLKGNREQIAPSELVTHSLKYEIWDSVSVSNGDTPLYTVTIVPGSNVTIPASWTLDTDNSSSSQVDFEANFVANVLGIGSYWVYDSSGPVFGSGLTVRLTVIEGLVSSEPYVKIYS